MYPSAVPGPSSCKLRQPRPALPKPLGEGRSTFVSSRQAPSSPVNPPGIKKILNSMDANRTPLSHRQLSRLWTMDCGLGTPTLQPKIAPCRTLPNLSAPSPHKQFIKPRRIKTPQFIGQITQKMPRKIPQKTCNICNHSSQSTWTLGCEPWTPCPAPRAAQKPLLSRQRQRSRLRRRFLGAWSLEILWSLDVGNGLLSGRLPHFSKKIRVNPCASVV